MDLTGLVKGVSMFTRCTSLMRQPDFRDSQAFVQCVKQLWCDWAGPPQHISHDEGGEFMSQSWKDFLQENGIHPVVSAAPWQRGRIERHGGTLQEMLKKIDHHRPIENLQ